MKSILQRKINSAFAVVPFIILLLLVVGCSSSGNDDSIQQPPQEFGNINGVVQDDEGNAYTNVKIELEKSGQSIESTTTKSDGSYEMKQLEIGNYQLKMNLPLGSEAVGDATANIVVSNGATANQDFTIKTVPVSALLVSGLVDVLDEMMNVQRAEPTASDELLYTPSSVSDPNSDLVAILAPDDHHMTFGEWQKAEGSATVSCDGSTTKYSMEFTGLIPDGVYTIWNFVLNKKKSPGSAIDFDTDFIGAGALKSGNSNIMVASASGDAQLEVEVNPGTMSMFGTLPSCVPSVAPGFVLIINYHIDGQTHGGFPGPDNTDVAHMLIYF